ncbi:MAK10-like protein [Tanacetum coccineum]|uniref:MAK10-like protein n=1 Tax=Tanacetum coccineum TaxID=301880 RepID=A0ABQ4XX24_9ASTR
MELSHQHILHGPNPQPQALGTTFEARVRDYMAAHTERMERFENVIFKQHEEINDRMTEMFGLLKELMTSRAPKKVLIREEAKFPITKNLNSISLTRGAEEMSEKTNVTTSDDFEKPTKTEIEMPVKEAVKEDEAENEPNKKAEKEKRTEAPSSQPVEYYLKHRNIEKLIKGLVGSHRFNDSLPGARVRKITGNTYNLSPTRPVYEAILRKKIIRKVDIGGNFEIACKIGGLKHVNALVDQGSDVNIMPLSTYMKLTDERPALTDIRLSLASHSYIYPLGIVEDVLVEVVEHVYPMDFVILDIKEDEKRPFILRILFLTTAKAVMKFYKGTITLRSEKSKIRFHMIPESLCKIERGVKNDIEHIAHTMTVNRLVLEWEERIKLHLERKMEFDQWKSKNFKGKHPALVKVEGGMDDKGEITKFLIKNEEEIFTDAGDGVRIYPDGVASPAMLYLTRRSLEVLRKFHWTIFGGRFNQLSYVSSPLLSKPEEYYVFSQKINTAYPLPLDTVYRSIGTNLSIEEVMTEKGKKSSIETFVPNDKADYYFGITSITVNRKNAYELKGKFLNDLHNNAFSGRKDVVEHIEYYLKIIDPIKLPNVDHDKLRIVIFPISLAGGARRWFDRTKESITCWVDLTAKFFGKYYPPSRIEGNNTPVIKWDLANPRFKGGDEIEVSDDESSDLEEYWSDKEETAKNFKIETDVFDYETPLCLAFNEFNYLLKVDPDLLTKDIMGWREDGYCNGGNLPGAYHIGNSLHYQDLEWYEALEDSELKDKALRKKAIMEGLISDDESCNYYWRRWKSHEITYHDHDEIENETHDERQELCEAHELPVCNIRRFKRIKYSFGQDEEYVAVKEDEYDDLARTTNEACRAYQEIFRMMDEGWMVARTE